MKTATIWIPSLLIVFLAFVCTPPGAGSKRRHCRDRDPGSLPDESYLSIPVILEEMKTRGLIHNEDGLEAKWNIERIADSGDKKHYCLEIIYMTFDLEREPKGIVHRQCDLSAETGSCLPQSQTGQAFTYTCIDQFTYRKVQIRRRWKFQKVFTGCTCSATSRLLEQQ